MLVVVRRAGVVLYILLCGFPPFWASTNPELERSIQTAPVDFSHPRWDTVSSEAKDLVERMLNKDPRRRASALEIFGEGGHGEWRGAWSGVCGVLYCIVYVETCVLCCIVALLVYCNALCTLGHASGYPCGGHRLFHHPLLCPFLMPFAAHPWIRSI